MSLSLLASRAGLSRNTMEKIEKGQTGMPRPITLRLLADVLGVDEDWLRAGDVPPSEAARPLNMEDLIMRRADLDEEGKRRLRDVYRREKELERFRQIAEGREQPAAYDRDIAPEPEWPEPEEPQDE